MKILKFHAENFKRVKVVDITPVGNTIVVSGRNGAGKSSVLDAIWAALGGGKAVEDIQRPVRDGASGAVVRLELDGLVVTRKWTSNDKSYLTVESNGMVARTPQALLDKLVGSLSFDPLVFSQGNAKWQRETLLGLTSLGIDLVEWERIRADVYAKRAGVNRLIEAMCGAIANMPVIPDGVPDAELGADAIIAEMDVAQKTKDENTRKRQALLGRQRAMENTRERVDETTRKVEALRKELAEEEGILRKMKDTLSVESKENADMAAKINLLKDPEMFVFAQKLGELQKTNSLVREKQKRLEREKELQRLKSEGDTYSGRLKELESEKNEAVKAAKYPVEGLGFDDFGVTYKGIPFAQCSSAERLRVSVAMAMAMNPKLRVVRIADGSLLDSQNMKTLQAMAAEHDFQVWIEVVDESGKMGVYIEDGEVANV